MFPRRYFPGGGTRYIWPTPDPEGPVMRPLAKLATLLAMTPAFQVRCGLSGTDADGPDKLIEGKYSTKRRIFYPEVDWNNFDQFPSAVLQFGPDWHSNQRAGGERHALLHGGNLRMVLIDEDQHPHDPEASLRDFGTYVGQLLDDLTTQFGYDDELNGHQVTQEQPPARAPTDEAVSRGRSYWSAVYLIAWGQS